MSGKQPNRPAGRENETMMTGNYEIVKIEATKLNVGIHGYCAVDRSQTDLTPEEWSWSNRFFERRKIK